MHSVQGESSQQMHQEESAIVKVLGTEEDPPSISFQGGSRRHRGLREADHQGAQTDLGCKP